MNKPITKGYVEGYKDATAKIHASINNAVVKGGDTHVKILDTIIANMYLQNEEVKDLQTHLDNQLSDSECMFDNESENGGNVYE